MKAIIRGYGIRMSSEERQNVRAQASDITRVRGTSQKPQPPRDVICQSAPRGIFVTWNYPSVNADIQRWRVYKDNENTLFAEIKDRGTRQCFVDTTAGASPPAVNIFVSSLNALGVESQKVQTQGKASAESTAPSFPSVPPGYTSVNSGGGDLSTDYVRTPGANRSS